MQITKPAFVVAELPGAVAEWVREMRGRFEPGIAHLPAEITLAGSSGVGPIAPGQSVDSVQRMLAKALAGRLPFKARFTGIGNFPGTEIFFAAPEPGPFNSLHAAVVASGIAFGPSRFSYNPHCSLKGFTPLKPGQREAIESVAVPSEPFTISTVSVYEMAGMQPTRLFSTEG
jgi:2'-5' RNA ligase